MDTWKLGWLGFGSEELGLVAREKMGGGYLETCELGWLGFGSEELFVRE